MDSAGAPQDGTRHRGPARCIGGASRRPTRAGSGPRGGRPALRARLAALATVLAAVLLVPVQAAADRDRAELRPYLSIEALPPLHGRRWSLYRDGPFARGDEARLERFIDAQAIHQADVYLNSPGGSLLAGMAVGRVLRARGYDTHVARRGADPARPMAGVCYSACPFAYAGGVERSLPLGSSLGLHRARNSVPVADAAAFERRVSRDVEEYLSQMGVSPVLARLMEQVPPDGIRLLSVAEAREFGLVTRPQPSR